MLKGLITYLVLIVLLADGNAQADTLAVPKQRYFRAQFAGNIGLISAGLGREYFNSKVNADISLGYLSKYINGARVITVSFRPAWNMVDFDPWGMKTDLYLGAAINYTMGRKIYGQIPDYYPQDYYWPNAFNFNPFAGIRLGSAKSRLKIFAELGTVDYMIWFAWKNRHVSIPDILNLALGFTVDVPKKR